MKYLILTVFIIGIYLFCSSCEKIIDIETYNGVRNVRFQPFAQIEYINPPTSQETVTWVMELTIQNGPLNLIVENGISSSNGDYYASTIIDYIKEDYPHLKIVSFKLFGNGILFKQKTINYRPTYDWIEPINRYKLPTKSTMLYSTIKP